MRPQGALNVDKVPFYGIRFAMITFYNILQRSRHRKTKKDYHVWVGARITTRGSNTLD